MTAWKAVGALVGGMMALQAHADVWQGEVGGAPVVMEWSVNDDGTVDGRYFYRKYHSDIALTGKRDKQGALRLGENLGYDESRVDLVLRPEGAGWVGEWRGPKAKRGLPVKLSLLAKSKESGYGAEEGADGLSAYNHARVAGLRLKPAGVKVFQGYRLAWWVEPESRVRWFRLASGYPGATMARLNQALEQWQWRAVAASFDCEANDRGRGMAEYTQEVIPHLLTPSVLSMSVETSYFCGGAHPDFSNSTLNLEVASGRDMQLEDVLWLGRGKPQDARDAKGKLRDASYESKVLRPWLVRTFGELYPNEMEGEDGSDCDYRDVENWNPASWYLTPEGVQIGAYFPRVERACDDPGWSLLPWSLVRKHPGTLTSRLP
ncbi:hypothetical protein [Chromobacterium paludis]|uniref:DUF3298 domain-containing protein n=1 Tax=Chromobacterium paludis TaxID=2605945 RepID=A0A5C1DK55_9NEIS|nr:hypothetical protein [Chromobacterium paludis]QEL56990.1 hypothetical protein FYK34_16180 [Chromobacterium paludis]